MSSIDMANKVKPPAHIPSALVYEFDYNTDPEYWKDPHARAADVIKNAPPLFWTPFNGGHWMFQSYEAVADALRDYETFSSEHFSDEGGTARGRTDTGASSNLCRSAGACKTAQAPALDIFPESGVGQRE
jgi:hypothetical protein